MDKLPPELLSEILLYLSPLDRLNCSLTCRRLAEVITNPLLLNGIRLNIAGHEIEAAASVLMKSQRQYTKLLLFKADLSEFDSEFWETIGANLRVLELERCSWSSKVFYSVLQQCTKLESLKIVDRDNVLGNFVPPKKAGTPKLRKSLSHLRHLHLDIEHTAEILDLLLRLMPNVTSIIVTTRYHEAYDLFDWLPSILRRNRILRMGADLHGMRLGSDDVIKFVEMTSESLEELQFDSCFGQLTENACEAIANCTRLRSFILTQVDSSFNASHLKKLVANSPHLEILELSDILDSESDIIRPLSNLRKLHTLFLSGRGTGINIKSLSLLSKISTLVKLDLTAIDINSRVLRKLGSLRNLGSLILRQCKSSKTLQAICENFEKLTSLCLGWVGPTLTDDDGIKLRLFRELRSLEFSGGIGFTDKTFEGGVGSWAMRSLRIEDCSITDAGLMRIAFHHGRLEELYIINCSDITDTGIVSLLQNEPRMKKFDVSGNGSVRREMLKNLRDLCPQLLHDWE